MEGVRCPTIVGRADELTLLRAAVDAAGRGHGSAAVLAGEAGVGKSRLAADLAEYAASTGLRVLRGRAVDGPHPVTFRPLTEAFLAALRDGSLPGDDRLEGFGPAVGRLLPGRPVPAGDPSVIAVAEGVLRLLRLLSQARGCLLVLEDLHWADPETLAVLEFLADHCAGERLACVATMRVEQPSAALTLASALDARGAARRITVRRLSDVDVGEMVRACLGSAAVPSEVDSFVAGRADGLPFFVEELLVGLLGSGALVPGDGGWRAVSRLVPAVPLTVTASIRARLDASPGLHEVLAAAATLGRRFDWELLADITGVEESAILQALRAGVANQLLDAGDTGFRFRHALTRDAVLSLLLPPERTRLCAAAAAALERRYPSLDGDRCELAATLHESAGDPARAAELLVEAADRAARRGALSSAEALLTRAVDLGNDRASVALLHVLALGGQTARVFELGDKLLGTSDSAAEVRIALARAAVSAGQWDRAAEHVRYAESPEATVLAAQVAMGRGDEPGAAELARVALGVAEERGLAEVRCEALEILGRVVRASDTAAAESLFERALATAEEAGLTVWRLRALHELGTIDLLDTGRLDRMEAARNLAVETGALAVLAVIDLHLGDMLIIADRGPEAIAAATRCVELSRRLGLSTLPVGLGHLAGHEASAGRIEVAEELVAEMRRIAPDEPDALAGAPVVYAVYALGRADDRATLARFDEVAAVIERHPAVPFPHRGVWALLHTVYRTPRAEEARETVRRSGATGIRGVRAAVVYMDAVVAGQRGRGAEAMRFFAEAERIMDGYVQPRLLKEQTRRLVAIAALEDGWGEPVAWLRGALAWAEETGREHFAADCRARLKQAGAPAPRRRTQSAGQVPERLRALGVTAREMQVLTLIADGLSNAEIGERLFISPRTVEKHVEKLLARTGTRTRGQLAVTAERLRMG